jgi:hypothetical protein
MIPLGAHRDADMDAFDDPLRTGRWLPMLLRSRGRGVRK